MIIPAEYTISLAVGLIIVRIFYFFYKRRRDTALPAAGGVVVTGASSGIGEYVLCYLVL